MAFNAFKPERSGGTLLHGQYRLSSDADLTHAIDNAFRPGRVDPAVKRKLRLVRVSQDGKLFPRSQDFSFLAADMLSRLCSFAPKLLPQTFDKRRSLVIFDAGRKDAEIFEALLSVKGNILMFDAINPDAGEMGSQGRSITYFADGGSGFYAYCGDVPEDVLDVYSRGYLSAAVLRASGRTWSAIDNMTGGRIRLTSSGLAALDSGRAALIALAQGEDLLFLEESLNHRKQAPSVIGQDATIFAPQCFAPGSAAAMRMAAASKMDAFAEIWEAMARNCEEGEYADTVDVMEIAHLSGADIAAQSLYDGVPIDAVLG